ncbi:MAG: peptidase M14 [Chloroflexi bacterium]|nr:peptidase M14 [Chloroflexota bacterium]
MNRPVALDINHYFDHQELSAALRSLVQAYPDLAKLHVVAKSHQGREVWLLEITGRRGGPAASKPGYYLDANTHAEELCGSNVALYAAWHLLTHYGQDPEVTDLLDWQVFYIVPRLDPDGAEICLKEPFYEWIGNGRYLPGDEQFGPGLHYADVNGDGVIVDMRIRDDKGEWKISERDPRLMVPREPYEYGGEYYRMIPEGMIEGFDGSWFDIPRPQDGNLNRNYPYGWGPEGEEYGSGQYPMSEPEIKGAVEFVLAHPNIVSSLHYHTNAGVLLMPTWVAGEPLPLEDGRLFGRLGEIGEALTGYHALTSKDVFHFPGHKPRMGTASAFLYAQVGNLTIGTELWDVFKEAGIEKDWYFPLRELAEADSLKLLKWNDEQLGGEGFMPWTPFEHPQLGPVEIGGWKRLFMFRNPPARLLEGICQRNALFNLRHAAFAPRLRLAEAEALPIADGVWKVRATVENVGYLPTYITQRALTMKTAQPVTVELELGPNVELALGAPEVDLGHLAGRSNRYMAYSRFIDWHADSKKAEWVVRLSGADRGEVVVRAASAKGGQQEHRIRLTR